MDDRGVVAALGDCLESDARTRSHSESSAKSSNLCAVFRAQLVAYCGDDLVQCRLVPGEELFLRQPDGQQIHDFGERCDAIIAATRAALRIRQEIDDVLRGAHSPRSDVGFLQRKLLKIREALRHKRFCA